MPGHPDMVRSFLETLIEKVTGADKAVADAQGDYSIEWRGARYWARVDGHDVPVVRVFSTVLVHVPASAGLLERLNEINSRMAFLRAFWVQDQVIFEHEHLGMTLQREEFENSFGTVASASDHFGPLLHEEFGGTPGFHESKTEEYAPPEVDLPGYL